MGGDSKSTWIDMEPLLSSSERHQPRRVVVSRFPEDFEDEEPRGCSFSRVARGACSFIGIVILSILTIVIGLLVGIAIVFWGGFSGEVQWHVGLTLGALLLEVPFGLGTTLFLLRRFTLCCTQKSDEAAFAREDRRQARKASILRWWVGLSTERFTSSTASSWFAAAARIVITLLLGEVVILVVAPCNSIIPLSTQIDVGFTRDPLTDGPCMEVIQQSYADSQSFFGDALDFENVHILNGGMPRYFQNAGAMGIDRCVYIDDYSSWSSGNGCINFPNLAHELTHIWEFESGWWAGPGGPLKLVMWFYKQSTCGYECLYPYGGAAGLHNAREAGQPFTDFGPEQMAMIMENWAGYVAGQTHDDFGIKYTPEYAGDLRFYASWVLNGTRILSTAESEFEQLIDSL